MSLNYKISVTYNAANLGVATNVFYMLNTTGDPSDDDFLILAAERWMENIYTNLTQWMAASFTIKEVRLDEVADDGSTVRRIGILDVDIDGISPGDPVALPTAGSSFCRTDVPRVQGRKRWPGLIEQGTVGGVWTNAFLQAIADATFEWLRGPGIVIILNHVAGVISQKTGGFVEFSNQAVATNIPGTQVTRKPLRGS